MLFCFKFYCHACGLWFLSGAQFKALVEYAPSQQVPKSNTKKDARQGTIMKGPRQSFNLILHPVGDTISYLSLLQT